MNTYILSSCHSCAVHLLFAARYIRIIADSAVEEIGPFYGSSAWGPAYKDVDLRTLKKYGNEWDYENDATVILIGS